MDSNMKHGFRSKFGGLWIDSLESEEVTARIAAIVDPDLRGQVADFERDGYVVLNQAVGAPAIDKYLQQFAEAAASEERLLMHVPFVADTENYSPEKARIPGSKVLDTSMVLAAGDELSFANPITRFLSAILDGPSLAFQSLHFEVGSVQTIHQDTAYVVVDGSPMKLVASWIALEDVVPGTGELVYYVGGHRMKEFLYHRGESKHFNVERDGPEPHVQHLNYINSEAQRMGLKKSTFLPKKGDVLLWHADLPHGGGEITKPGATRRSLVTHYCPFALTPHYLQFLPEPNRRKVRSASGNYFCSMYFPPTQFASNFSQNL
jgi:ectoine hydroxylase-related dioxygenase (phytanoyl-CoA dioxygenase family)